MDYKQKISTLTGYANRLVEIAQGLGYFEEYPPLTRGEAVQLDMLIEEHNSIVDEIKEIEDTLYANGCN